MTIMDQSVSDSDWETEDEASEKERHPNISLKRPLSSYPPLTPLHYVDFRTRILEGSGDAPLEPRRGDKGGHDVTIRPPILFMTRSEDLDMTQISKILNDKEMPISEKYKILGIQDTCEEKEDEDDDNDSWSSWWRSIKYKADKLFSRLWPGFAKDVKKRRPKRALLR